MFSRVKHLILLAGVLWALPSVVYGGNRANFVLYDHHTEEAGEMEIMFMNDTAQEPDGTRYNAQMIEFGLGVTDRWTTEFMIEGQATGGEGNYNFTGFRWENRYRFFDYGTPLNPVLYIEYEDLSEDTKYLMEVSGRTDAAEREKKRPRERVLESRLVLGQDITDRLDVALNWLNESDLDTKVTAFGYALGLNYKPFSFVGGSTDNKKGKHRFHHMVMLGLEFFGGLGDSDKGITADGNLTQHYVSPNIVLGLTGKIRIKIGGAIGLTKVSQDLFRLAVKYGF